MVEVIAIPALLAGLYALWLVGRTDALRLFQGVHHVRARVVRHVEGTSGFEPVYRFQIRDRTYEVTGPTAHAKPEPPEGTSVPLSFPRKRPDLARPPAPMARGILYAGFAAWLAFFSDLMFGWLS